MPSTTRERIVDAADQLIYEHGFEHTSFAQIADSVGISRGNFYHHFRTKNDILDAVIERRLDRTRDMLGAWKADNDTPLGRIRAFVHILIDNRALIERYGCPVGTLCAELGKLAHPARGRANELFVLFQRWLRRQFTELGCGDEAGPLAMHVLARSQGVSTLASTFQDEAFVRREVDDLENWLLQFSANNPVH